MTTSVKAVMEAAKERNERFLDFKQNYTEMSTQFPAVPTTVSGTLINVFAYLDAYTNGMYTLPNADTFEELLEEYSKLATALKESESQVSK
jgi:hypothetical protein